MPIFTSKISMKQMIRIFTKIPTSCIIPSIRKLVRTEKLLNSATNSLSQITRLQLSTCTILPWQTNLEVQGNWTHGSWSTNNHGCGCIVQPSGKHDATLAGRSLLLLIIFLNPYFPPTAVLFTNNTKARSIPEAKRLKWSFVHPSLSFKAFKLRNRNTPEHKRNLKCD